MGEAKLKRRSHAAILSGQPGCIYCAGTNAAATIEHMPPISAFRGRQRPKGLEFPACQACNNGTGRSDLVGALLARVWPDASSEVQRADVVKLLRAVANNVPGLLEEMDVGRGAEKIARKQHNLDPDVHPMRADGPLLNHRILTFAAKMGFALHYELRRAPIPAAGGIQVMWFSNLQALNGQIPSELFDLLPSPSTLRQGSKSVADQFEYSYAPGERDHMLYFASFSASFAVAGITAVDRSLYLNAHVDRFPIFGPGDFRQPQSTAPFRSGLENGRSGAHIRGMARERYIARRIQHWHVVRISADGKETVMEITDSEEAAKAEAAKLDREAERTYQAE